MSWSKSYERWNQAEQLDSELKNYWRTQKETSSCWKIFLQKS